MMEHIEIPASTQNRIIVPSNSAGNRFLKKCYINEYLEAFISEREFNEVIEAASKKTQVLFMTKRKQDHKKHDRLVH